MSDRRSELQEKIESLERQIFIATQDSDALDKPERKDPVEASAQETSIESLESRVEELEKQLRSLD